MNYIMTAKLTLFIPVLALLAACGAQTQTALPDGTMATRIDCSAQTGGLNFCFEKAGKSCGADGYTILARDGQAISSSNATETERIARIQSYQTDGNSILIKCGT